MQENSNTTYPNKENILQLLHRLLNLRTDTDRDGTLELIQSNVEFRSANAWTLVFAILIASVGLNVNSAAVIIGAMLISPLMGPIVGVGFALGVYDFVLLKKSTKKFSCRRRHQCGCLNYLFSLVSDIRSSV